DSKADELLLGTDAVDVVVKATVTRAGQIAAATENSIAEPAPSTAETSAGSSRFLPVVRVTSSRARAASGHVAAAPPSSVMNSRRFILPLTRSPHRRGRAAWATSRGQAPSRF